MSTNKLIEKKEGGERSQALTEENLLRKTLRSFLIIKKKFNDPQRTSYRMKRLCWPVSPPLPNPIPLAWAAGHKRAATT